VGGAGWPYVAASQHAPEPHLMSTILVAFKKTRIGKCGRSHGGGPVGLTL
jgi:hypothetical protein